jgi:hypothetical protein
LPSPAAADALADKSLVSVRVEGAEPIRQRVVAIHTRGDDDDVPSQLWDLLMRIPEFVPGTRRLEPLRPD